MMLITARPTPEALLARLHEGARAWLRVYIGAAPGVGKTYRMLEDARAMRQQGVDIVIALVESHGRAETAALVEGIERVPMRQIEYRGVVLEEMDVETVIARRPAVALVDELAHTNVLGAKHAKRHEDVSELLDCGISVITAVNVQHIQREQVPRTFLTEADEIVGRPIFDFVAPQSRCPAALARGPTVMP